LPDSGRAGLIKWFTEVDGPGLSAYLREGEVGAGDAVEVVHRPAHGVTIGETFRRSPGPLLGPRLLEASELAGRGARARAGLAALMATNAYNPESLVPPAAGK